MTGRTLKDKMYSKPIKSIIIQHMIDYLEDLIVYTKTKNQAVYIDLTILQLQNEVVRSI